MCSRFKTRLLMSHTSSILLSAQYEHQFKHTARDGCSASVSRLEINGKFDQLLLQVSPIVISGTSNLEA